MHIDFQYAQWGMIFAALIYVIGNATWTNHIARRHRWAGWLMWIVAAVLVLVAGAAVEARLAGGETLATLTQADGEKHWIILTLFALLSVPGAACVLFRQSVAWTRFAVSACALLLFIPLGTQINDPNDPRLSLSLGITLAVVGILWMLSMLLDSEPEHRRKTVPVEEADA
ncbi:MAG: hypothetical protein D6678_01010 [Zetaproteobacteria bacterium]|nr:MAG: hypothetical protein D6678_01010 [Zetaproteobacteria bacterium]